MGQAEVFSYLRTQRAGGRDEFVSASDVRKALRETGTNGGAYGVPGDLRRLEVSGFLEGKCVGKWNNWRRVYRLKKKHV